MEDFGLNLGDSQHKQESRRKKGLCETCGLVKTHKVDWRGRRTPVSSEDAANGECVRCQNPLPAPMAMATNGPPMMGMEDGMMPGLGGPDIPIEIEARRRDMDDGTLVTELTTPSILKHHDQLTMLQRAVMEQQELLDEEDEEDEQDEDIQPMRRPPERSQDQMPNQEDEDSLMRFSAHSWAMDRRTGQTEDGGNTVDFSDDRSGGKITVNAGNRHSQDNWSNPLELSNEEMEFLGSSPKLREAPSKAVIQRVADAVKSLQDNEQDAGVHRKAFEELTQISGQRDGTGKDAIVSKSGIKAIVEGMWRHMDNVEVQIAAVRALWALSASDNLQEPDETMSEKNAEGAVDAMIISMQQHADNATLQMVGCGTLCCLAIASRKNPAVNDGTAASGATLVVSNAMNMHEDHMGVIEWGMRALYNQCTNSDSNKVALFSSDNYVGGQVDIIQRSIAKAVDKELPVVEWACRLYWCLSANDRAASGLSNSARHINALVDAMRHFDNNLDAADIHEVACGAIANLALLTDKNHAVIRQFGGVAAIVKSMRFFEDEEAVQLEACAALANISTTEENAALIFSEEGVQAVLAAMESFPDNHRLQEEACRTLLCLAIKCADAREFMLSDLAISSIILALNTDIASASVQEMACSLLANLAMSSSTHSTMVRQGAIHSILIAMKNHRLDRNLLESATLCLRNLSATEDTVASISDANTANALVKAMIAHPDSPDLQENSCCVLWSLSEMIANDRKEIVDCDGIKVIVQAMQSHMESHGVQEMACGALWSLVTNSEENKAALAVEGGIDPVVITLLMHPKQAGALACGVLSCMSTQKDYASSIQQANGISFLSEAMISNLSSLSLIENGCILIRNMASHSSIYADEAVSAISSIIIAMKENPDAVGLQREALNALWSLAAQSRICNSRIAESDAKEVITKAMTHNIFVVDIQEASKGVLSHIQAVQ
eukprot:CAMPEP_0198285318 /NCGR_PEP_ID=MMETSP1449-20131203/4647_1 /TAXON_ID=420275 /ORGANISM="Attheya septentrionalis, Strain CCMP2084" /LENGTH=953 /DNA_ID=CAMNT_0043982721 /DNA_START=77 /DNA_END=2938 /DNA_ORIENTATION=-